MLAKLFVLSILYAAVIIGDRNAWRNGPLYERFVYGGVLAVSLYLSFQYTTDMYGPNLDDVMHSIFARPAEAIVNALKAPS